MTPAALRQIPDDQPDLDELIAFVRQKAHGVRELIGWRQDEARASNPTTRHMIPQPGTTAERLHSTLAAGRSIERARAELDHFDAIEAILRTVQAATP